MNKIRLRTVSVGAVATAALTFGGFAAAPAASAAARPADWNGTCTASNTSTAFGGYCNGTGPQIFRAVAWCKDGTVAAIGIAHWFGDTRGSTASCAGYGGLGTKWGYFHCDQYGNIESYISYHGGAPGTTYSDMCVDDESTAYIYYL